MKKITTVLLACVMIVTLALAVSAYWEAEEAFLEVKFTIGKQTVAWNPDGVITEGEYYKVDIDPAWLSYAINDSDTDAGLAYAKSVTPELYMSWDETGIYTATVYTVPNGHENLWDGDPASMWYSGAVQFNYANFDEVASEYRLEYGVGLSSDTGDTLYTVWADGAATGFTPSEENARVWLNDNTLTYETKVLWEDFADEDNTAGKEGLGFNFCLVWSIGEGQDYVHIQLAEGCTGNGKHAENFAQVTLGPAQAASEPAAPAAGSSSAAMFTDVDSYASFEMGGDAVYAMDDEEDIADWYAGNWDSPGDNGNEITVEIVDGVGYAGTKGISVSSDGNSNVGLYFYATTKNGITRSYPGANYLRVWMDLSEVGFRKANFGIVDGDASLFTTDEVDGAWDCPFWFSADGVEWTEYAHGGDGCFGDAQDSDVFGLAGFFAFPIKDFTIRSNANWEAYDELTPADPSNVWAVYMFWDYSDNRPLGNAFIIDNIEFVQDYKAFDYDVVATESSAEEVSFDLPEITTDAKALLDSADVYLSFDDGISDAKGHTVNAVGENTTVDGISGKAVKMNSETGYLSLDGYTFGTDSFTVVGWFNTEESSGDQCLFSNKDWGSGGNPGWLVTQRGGDWKVNINAEGGSRTDKECGFGMIPAEFEFSPTNQWYFLAAVVDREAGTYKLYINGRDFYMPGEFTADNNFDGLAFDSGLPFNIGQDGTGAYGDGKLVTTYDEIAIFKKALTHEEVAALYTLNAKEGAAAEAEAAKGFADVNTAAAGKNVITAYEFVEGTNGFGSELPANLFDGDTATKFCTNEFPATGIAKLDGLYTITGFTMATANDNADYNGRSPNAWTISVSGDGLTWTELAKGDDSFFEETNFTYYVGEASAEGVGYVKFTADSTASGTFQVSELTLFGDRTGDLVVRENYAKGAAVTVSSTETADFPGELAVDGDMATRWASAYTDDEYITIDLGTAKAVNYVALYWETAKAADYEIYGSLTEDNLEEKTLATVTGNADANNILEFETTAVRYLTIHSSKRATEWGNSLYEIVVSGEGDANVDAELEVKSSPNTFDIGIIAAVASVISLAGFAVAKKH